MKKKILACLLTCTMLVNLQGASLVSAFSADDFSQAAAEEFTDFSDSSAGDADAFEEVEDSSQAAEESDESTLEEEDSGEEILIEELPKENEEQLLLSEETSAVEDPEVSEEELTPEGEAEEDLFESLENQEGGSLQSGAASQTVISEGIYGGYINYEIRQDSETGISEAVLTDVVSDPELQKSYVTQVAIPDEINGYPVTTIGFGAFSGCENLSGISWGKNIKTIYSSAFRACKSLSSVTIPLNVEVVGYDYGNPMYRGPFSGTSLTSVQIPEGMTKIPPALFEGCEKLSSISIPDTVTEIGANAFEGCRSLSGITFPKNLAAIGNRAFLDCVSLKNVVLPEELEKLECGAFAGCTSFTEVNIPPNVKMQDFVGDNYQYPGPFADCSNLKKIRFAEGTTKILGGLFYQCSGLEEIVIPDSVTQIQEMAFKTCENLKKVVLPKGLKRIESYAFMYCSSLTDIVLPDDLEFLGSWAFTECTALEKINIPANLKTSEYAGANAAWAGPFSGCNNLTEVSFADGTTSIDRGLFWQCGGIQSVHIPETVESIGHRTFNTGSLKEIWFEGSGPKTDDSISNKSGLTAYVYGEFWDTYKTLRSTYNKVNWIKIGKYEGSVQTDFEIELNYRGYAYAYAPLLDEKGNLRPDTTVQYICRDDASTGTSYEVKEAASDDSGYVLFETPLLTRNNDPGIDEDIRDFHFAPAEDEKDLLFQEIGMKVTITPLSFKEKIKAVAGEDITVDIGPGAGVAVGPVDLEANLIAAEGTGGISQGVTVEFERSGDLVKMKLTSLYNQKVEGALKSGLEGNLLGAETKVLNASGKINATTITSRGIEINNLEKMSSADKTKLGRFLLFMALGGLRSSNAAVARIFDKLNIGSADFYSDGVKLAAGGDFTGAKISLPKTEKTLNLGGLGTAFSISVDNGVDNKQGTLSRKTELSVKDSVTAASGPILDKLMLPKGEVLTGTYSLGYTKNKSQGGGSLIVGTTTATGTDSGMVEKSVAEKRNYQLNDDNGNFESLLSSPVLGNKLSAFMGAEGVLFSAGEYISLMNGIAKNYDEVPVQETKEASKRFYFNFPIKLKALIGAEAKFAIEGSQSIEYSTGNGTYVVDKGTRYSTKNDIEAAAAANEIDFSAILGDAGQAILKQVEGLYETVTKPLKSAVSFGAAVVKQSGSTVKNWVVSITGMKKEKTFAASYSVPAFASAATAMEAAEEGNVEEEADAAATVGEPYVIYVEDENGNEITDFSEAPLSLELSYTDEDLALAGTDGGNLENLSVYYYDETSGAYIYAGGTLNQEEKKVTAIIEKPGQYTLAVDDAAPVISNIEVSDASATPVITANIQEFSGISEFSFKLDDKELVTAENLNKYYKPSMGLFSYTCEEPLKQGEHTGVLSATDEKGYTSEESFTFMVDTTPPEITDAYAEVIGQKAKITAKVADITQPYVYADITYLKGDKSYHTETELVKAEDSYTAEYEFDRKEICRKITIIAIDEAGNKSSADAYEKSEQELMYPLPMISFGNDHGALVKEDRSLWTWGDNGYGQLGVKYAPEGVPQKIMDNVIQVSCRRDTSAAVTADGVLYMWGYNGYGNFGNNSYSNSSQPVRIMDNVAQVVCGEFCTAAITRDGSLYMWGYNDFGQIGDGTTADKATPVKIMDNVKQVSIGARHCAAVTTDGIMYAWGDNDYYQFGNWSRESSLVPVKIMSKVESISLGAYHSAAVTEDGSLYIWGYNNKGQLGTGTTQSSAGPVKILDNVAKIFMEQNTSSAVTDDGTLYMWGSNPNGILGQGSEERILLPAAIMENTAQAAVGTTFAGLLKTDGSLWLTGENYSGQLGDTDADDRTQFEELPMTAFSKLVISASEAEMYVGETLQLTANLEGEKIPEGASFSWSSMDTSVVEVDSHGLVKAVGTGATYIKVSCNNKEEMCWITVSRRPTVIIAKTVAEMESSHDYNDDECSIWVYTFSGAKSLKVTFSEETYVENHYDYLDIYDGDDNLIDFYTGYELAGKTITVDGDTVKVKLTSDSSGTDYGFKVVSIVNEKGAAAPGSENVPVTNPTVTAAPKPTAVPVPTKKPAGPSVCSSHSFGAWTVTKKATVMEAGTKSRTCRICNYTEKQTIAKLKPTIKLTATKIPLKVKQSTTKLKVSGLAAGDKVVSWKSKNTKIVKVNSKGKLTAQKKTGKTTVTVTLASGLKKNITVTVQKGNVKTTKISGLSKKITLKKGKKLNLKPVITPITSLEKVTYSSSNNKIVSVDKKGKLTAKKAGSAKITVKSGKKKFVITVTVPKK